MSSQHQLNTAARPEGDKPKFLSWTEGSGTCPGVAGGGVLQRRLLGSSVRRAREPGALSPASVASRLPGGPPTRRVP